MKTAKLMLGNEAMARGLVENGCAVATSYPGTPASEILSSAAAMKNRESLPMHVQWAVNEKVAFEIAYAASMTGLRAAVSMKQVGLNVASDPLMSAAYMGVKGGFVVICADDPGPHSSQTEQDSRLMAMSAKIPVLDPDSPDRARQMVETAYELSETFEIPVMIRPTTRICHSRQDIAENPVRPSDRKPEFKKDPFRWAATPKFRFKLHTELENKLAALAENEKTAPILRNPDARKDRPRKAVVASGVAAAHTGEIMRDLGVWDTVPFYQVLQPFPLHTAFIKELIESHEEVLVIEETTGVIEMQIADRNLVRGKTDGFTPRVGEILPEKIEALVGKFTGTEYRKTTPGEAPGRRPTLCPGCPHRASFFAIRKAAPKGIYTSDIGCYTLGLNLGAVDTVLCMGAAISQAAGFWHAFKNEEKRPDIVATIGDSTFFHAGVPALIDAVAQNVRFVLVILDNRTTAMTGNQPTPASGFGACGEPIGQVDIRSLVTGCGVKYCMDGDPHKLKDFTKLIKEAVAFSKENGPAVVISKRPCLIDKTRKTKGPGRKIQVEITDTCDACGFCAQRFECPAIIPDETEERMRIDPILCSGCGVCVEMCPKGSIVESIHS